METLKWIEALRAKVSEALERRQRLLDQTYQRLRSAEETLNASRRLTKGKPHDPDVPPREPR